MLNFGTMNMSSQQSLIKLEIRVVPKLLLSAVRSMRLPVLILENTQYHVWICSVYCEYYR